MWSKKSLKSRIFVVEVGVGTSRAEFVLCNLGVCVLCLPSLSVKAHAWLC